MSDERRDVLRRGVSGMEIRNRKIVILGGSGLVGMAVARGLLEHGPRRLVISALRRPDAERAVAELEAEGHIRPPTELRPEWGDLFLPESLRERSRAEMLADPESRRLVLDDMFGELTELVVDRSAFGALVLRHEPDVIIDCVNTATVFAYQNVYESVARLRESTARGIADSDAVESHLATLYLPQLIRHVQIALESMRRAGTRFYIKIGTSGTGGMGLNIPFTHSEERPSRTLLSKAGLAGAHTLLLYLMARTPGAPVVKEIKPTAAISWKRIGYGEIRRAGRPIELFDATRPLPLESAFGPDAVGVSTPLGDTLRGVFLDAGENGLFSAGEFEALSALGLMEYITPEEIAGDVIREILGHPTGRDVVAALDAATSGPTYRAGVLRGVALERMTKLEAEHGEAVAYEMLGPPRLSKLLFEAAILGRIVQDLEAATMLDPDQTALAAARVVDDDAELRSRILSIGLPVLLPDGRGLLRGPVVKVAPVAGQSPADPRLADNGWVDLRSENWRRWRERAARIAAEIRAWPGPDHGSRSDVETGDLRSRLRPGRLAAWVFRHEDRGERIKR